MKPSVLSLASGIFCCAIVLSAGPAASQHDCPGNFDRIPNYRSSMGQPCRYLGLNSRQGTCRPGDMYETLCDDADGGRYKICQGPRPCNTQPPPPPQQPRDCRQWDFVNNAPCPPGYVNVDCQGYCEQQSGGRGSNCEEWDFAYNRPCPEGYRNYDCQGGCEPVSFFGR